MISTTLSLWGKGAVTLPKKWRERFDTKQFLAKEDAKGNLVIKPIIDIQYYERSDGTVGLHFPVGIKATELLHMMQQAEKDIRKEERNKKTKRVHG